MTKKNLSHRESKQANPANNWMDSTCFSSGVGMLRILQGIRSLYQYNAPEEDYA